MTIRSSTPRGLPLRVAALVLAATIVLTAFVGRALATESPPEVKTLPQISAVGPYLGQGTYTTLGTWTGKPTKITVQWSRCLAGCEAIAGATGETYIPTSADVGKYLKVSATAYNEAGSSTADSKESAKVTERLSWYGCRTTGAILQYADANCSTSGPPNNYGWSRTSTSATASSNAQYIIQHTYGGVSIREDCLASSGSGTLENASNYVGISSYSLALSNCAVTQPAGKGCKVTAGETASISALSGATAPGSLKAEMTMNPAAGTPVAELLLEGCQSSYAFMNGHAFKIYGSVQASIGAGTNPSVALFTKEAGQLSADGLNASIEGASTITGTSYSVSLRTSP